MTSTTKRAKCLSGNHSSTDGGSRYAVSRSIVRKLLKSAHPETKKGRINVSILPDSAQCAKSDRLLVPRTRSSHHFSAGTVANFGFKSGTRIIELLVSFRFRSSLGGRGKCWRTSGSG